MRKEKEQRKIEIDVSEYETEYGVDWMKICEDYPILADTDIDEHDGYYWEPIYGENGEQIGLVESSLNNPFDLEQIIITYFDGDE